MPIGEGSRDRHSQPSAAAPPLREATGRLTAAADFAHVYQDGQLYSHRLLRMYCASARRGHTRSAYVAGRRVGTAVARNRAKRLMREAGRGLLPGAGPARDIVFVAHAPLSRVGLREARGAMLLLLRRAELVGEDE